MLDYMKWFCSRMVLCAEAPGDGGGGGGADTGAGGGGNDTVAAGGGGDTVAGGGGQDTVKAAVGNDTIKFPENWRDGLAAGDVKKIERLSRYGTPQAVADALLSVQERISKGELRSNVPFPEKGTEAEKTAWRQEQGIPAAAADYYKDIKLSDGRTVNDEDKPRLDKFISKMHERNANPAVVSAALDAYHDEVEARTNERLELDKTQVQATRDQLIASGGLPEFHTNMNLVGGMIEMMPEKVRDLFKGARLADGSPLLGGNADVFMGLVEMARAINPVGAVVPNSGDNSMATIDAEIAKNVKMMGTDRKAWDADPKNQARHLQLLEAQSRAKGQGK